MKKVFSQLVLGVLIAVISVAVPLALAGPRDSLHLMGGSTPGERLEGHLWWLGLSMLVVVVGGWAAFSLRCISKRAGVAVWLASLAGSIAAAVASQAEPDFVVLGIVHAVGVAVLVGAVLCLEKGPSRLALSSPGAFLVFVVNWVVLFFE